MVTPLVKRWGEVLNPPNWAVNLDSVAIIESIEDLPSAVGGQIEVDPNKTYILRTNLDLGADQLTGSVINIRGENSIGPYAFSITSTHPTATINSSGTVILLQVAVSNLGTGSAIVSTAGPTGIFYGDKSNAYSATGWAVQCTSGAIFSWEGGALQGTLGCIRLSGTISDVFIPQTLFLSNPGAPSYKAVRFDSSFSAGRAVMLNCQWAASQASDIGVSVDTAVAIAAPIKVIGGYFFGFTTPVDPAGVQKSQAKFLVRDTVGIEDSRFSGGAYITGNTTPTTFSLINTYVPIGTGSPAHPLFTPAAANERFSVTGSVTSNQLVVYGGLQAASFDISVNMLLSRAGVAASYSVALFINGVIRVDSVVSVEVQKPIFIRTSQITTLNPGDSFRARIACTTGTSDVQVNSVRLSVGLAV